MEKKYPSGHKKVLILYAPLGSGHGAAAQAIEEAFVAEYPDIEVRNINVLDFVPDVFKQGLPWFYNQTTSRIPFLYKWIYNYYKYKSRSKRLNNLSRVILKKSKFVEFIGDFKPDFIISTNPLSMQLISLTKEEKVINIPSANVCTDFGFYPLWHNKDVNYYFVANEEIKKSLVKYGVKSEKIQTTGIPTSSKFSKPMDRDKIINNLNFNPLNPIVLIVGGRILYRNVVEIIDGVKRKNSKAQFIVVAGRDKILYKKLVDSGIGANPEINIFGFIDNLEEYMSVADMILTKAGGLTVSECLVKNLPMLFNDIIPGQEEDNVIYAVKQGVGIRTSGSKKSADSINMLLSHPEKLIRMKKNCKKIAKPNAAKELVEFIVSKI